MLAGGRNARTAGASPGLLRLIEVFTVGNVMLGLSTYVFMCVNVDNVDLRSQRATEQWRVSTQHDI